MSEEEVRNIEEWEGREETQKPFYCFATRPYTLFLRPVDKDSENEKGFEIKIFILDPEDCSVYQTPSFMAVGPEIACVAAGSKIFLFGGGCQTQVWYLDVTGNGEQRLKWSPAQECLNHQKLHPVSFSLEGKIYALDTRYIDNVDDGSVCWFEVLDTRTPDSCWRPLPNPPHPFGKCIVSGSWSCESDENHGSRIYIQATEFLYYTNLFVYDVDTESWGKFRMDLDGVADTLYHSKFEKNCYPWALHLQAGMDFAPFLPGEAYGGDLRVVTGLNRSIVELELATSEAERGLIIYAAAQVDIDKKEKMKVCCKKPCISQFTSRHLESMWTLHCIPSYDVVFWQAIHVGGPRFCTLSFYLVSCNNGDLLLFVRVATFDITDERPRPDADDHAAFNFAAKYVDNKVYLVEKSIAVPLPCSQLFIG